MCTAMTYQTDCFYAGRNLDYEHSFGEQLVITPRHYVFSRGRRQETHYAMLGMAYVTENYPLYFDGVNEKGVYLAGLHFVGNAVYAEGAGENVAQYELIPWILGQCSSAQEAMKRLKKCHITSVPFRDDLPASPLHWLLADRKDCYVIEPTSQGVQVFSNPVGVLTNNPPFPFQLFALNNYQQLTAKEADNRFAPTLQLTRYSRGMGAMGLPGDFSSQSRFVRGAFVRMNSASEQGEEESVSQMFHMLGAVEQPRGCCQLENGSWEITRYIGCCNADRGIYYYTTYENRQLTAVDLHREPLDGNQLICYPLESCQQIKWMN